MTGLERALAHNQMRAVSINFSKPTWRDWRGQDRLVPVDLQRVAFAFERLQTNRHEADYDSSETWSVAYVEEIVNLAEDAFRHWNTIREDPMAGNYLLAMLLPRAR